MNDTIFDKIMRKEIPSETVYENDSVLAFRDIRPSAPIHVLVIPKKKLNRFSELHRWTAEETGIFFQNVSLVARELGLDSSGYRVVLNCGKEGGQEVEYLHAHILGGRQLKWPAG